MTDSSSGPRPYIPSTEDNIQTLFLGADSLSEIIAKLEGAALVQNAQYVDHSGSVFEIKKLIEVLQGNRTEWGAGLPIDLWMLVKDRNL
jgi:hypothetical protein